MKILLLTSSHSVYRDLINSPPENVYYNISDFAHTTKDFILLRKVKRFLWDKYIKLKPPSTYVKTDLDLIHSSSIMVLNKKPWVMDLEHVCALTGFHVNKLFDKNYRNKIIKILSSEYCKKIMPWTFAAKKSMENCFNFNWLKRKLEVVYPAFKVRSLKKTKNEKTKLLFVGRRFYVKGGKQVLDAFEILNRRYDVDLTIISDTPKEIEDKYKKIENIHFLPSNFTIETLVKNYYSKSDIFIFPSYIDTFGMVLLEAMSCGLPVITTDVYASPEIVDNSKTGFLIHSPFSCYRANFIHKWDENSEAWNNFVNFLKLKQPKIIGQIVEKTAILIENKSLRKRMGKSGRREIEKGKFSIKKRNEKLERIYEEAITLKK